MSVKAVRVLDLVKLPRQIFHLLALMHASTFFKNEQDVDFVEYC